VPFAAAAVAGTARTIAVAASARRTRSSLLTCAGDPDRVLAADIGPAVEPAVVGLHLEACIGEQRVPLRGCEPRQLHRRLGALVADGEGERPRVLVPVGALEDPRLALEPARVRLLDVVARRREHVEDEAGAGE